MSEDEIIRVISEKFQILYTKTFEFFYILTGTMNRTGIFETLPENFFSPLASPNRRHYAALLGLYWRTFQEFPRGVEWSVLVSRFTEYVSLCRETILEEDVSLDETPFGEDTGEPALFESGEGAGVEPVRVQATRFLRTLMAAGWMSIEILEDYSRMVNMTAWARPFYEAIGRIEEGLSTEYESHIVAVYSLLCSDAAEENGHYAVLNAHEATVALNDSLKVLLQGIRDYYENLDIAADEGGIASLLHQHYDLYAADILDGAYKRLKTSENLSRYRPRILKRVQELRDREDWLSDSAGKYARSSRIPLEQARERLLVMLEEIRDVLKGLDPLLSEIDRRNMQYARVSSERISLLLAPDSSITGRLALLAKGVADHPHLARGLAHSLFRMANLSSESRYRRWRTAPSSASFTDRSLSDPEELARIEVLLRDRISRQLSPARVSSWLSGKDRHRGPLTVERLVENDGDWVRLLYAVSYAESRPAGFDYSVSVESEKRLCLGRYDCPDLVFRRKHEN